MSTVAQAAELRSVAADLERRAVELSSAARRIDQQVAQMVFAGPAADDFRAAMAAKRQQLEHTAAELRGSAAVLVRSAAAVESAGPASCCC